MAAEETRLENFAAGILCLVLNAGPISCPLSTSRLRTHSPSGPRFARFVLIFLSRCVCVVHTFCIYYIYWCYFGSFFFLLHFSHAESLSYKSVQPTAQCTLYSNGRHWIHLALRRKTYTELHSCRRRCKIQMQDGRQESNAKSTAQSSTYRMWRGHGCMCIGMGHAHGMPHGEDGGSMGGRAMGR